MSKAPNNPHNPDFLTKKPWYLNESGDANDDEPTLSHQSIQQESNQQLSLSKAEELLQQQRKKQQQQRQAGGAEAFTKNQWVEGLKKNKLPYRICQILKVHKNGTYNVQYEDGSIEKKLKVHSKNSNLPRLRSTQSGNRALQHDYEETFDSKRDAYHGYNRHAHNEILVKKYEQKLQIRQQLREQQQQQSGDGGEGSTRKDNANDSDFSQDSDADDDEFVQKDADAKVLTTRLARQGGVGGAQMKVTARNLRIREDTAKYLRNLDPNSAYYDPKSRSMRDNPNPEAQESDFAGDNFARISGDAVNLAQQQLFAWDAAKRGVTQVHPQANPSQAEYLQKQFVESNESLKNKKKQSILEKYGGEEYLQESSSQDAKLRFGEVSTVQDYNRDGTQKGVSKPKTYNSIPCKYEENVYINGHTTVWGSYFHKGAFCWGYEDDHSLMKQSYCTGPKGRLANDEANLKQFGTGQAGSAALAQARALLNPKRKAAPSSAPPPPSQSKLYGQADQDAQLDPDKVRVAVQELQNDTTKKQKKYHSNHEVEMTEEMMEAYRLTKSNANDPMANIGSDQVLDYEQKD